MLIKNINKLLYILLIVIIVLLIALSTIVIVYFFRKSPSRNGLYRKDECIVNYSDIIKKNSIKYKVDENLIYAIIMTESSFNKDAVSKAGAIGLMQLMPDTYEDIKGKLGYDQPAETALRDPEINISCGVYYFVTYCSGLGDNASIAAYNAGPNRVKSWLMQSDSEFDLTLEEIPIDSVRNYVKKVRLYYSSYNYHYGIAENYNNTILQRESAAEYAIKYGRKYKVDYNFIMAIMETESSFYCYRVSKTGAIGLMQIMGETFRVDIANNLNLDDDPDQLFDPEFNVMSGSYLLHWLDDRLDGITEIATAYHVGINQTLAWLQDENYSSEGHLVVEKLPEEVQNYLFKVMGFYRRSIRLDGEDKAYKFEE